LAASYQEEEVAMDTTEETMKTCDWCSATINGAFSEYDGSHWHPACLAKYLHYKNRPVREVPSSEFVCPMGGHTHRNPFGIGGDTAL
jgi:hypothetical protein